MFTDPRNAIKGAESQVCHPIPCGDGMYLSAVLDGHFVGHRVGPAPLETVKAWRAQTIAIIALCRMGLHPSDAAGAVSAEPAGDTETLVGKVLLDCVISTTSREGVRLHPPRWRYTGHSLI